MHVHLHWLDANEDWALQSSHVWQMSHQVCVMKTFSFIPLMPAFPAWILFSLFAPLQQCLWFDRTYVLKIGTLSLKCPTSIERSSVTLVWPEIKSLSGSDLRPGDWRALIETHLTFTCSTLDPVISTKVSGRLLSDHWTSRSTDHRRSARRQFLSEWWRSARWATPD